MASLFSILLDYAIFAFVINLIRSLEDINGDTSQGMSCVVLGILKTTKLVFPWGLYQ
jgi:4-hydroxybenzoate polyprenyltransferase